MNVFSLFSLLEGDSKAGVYIYILPNTDGEEPS